MPGEDHPVAVQLVAEDRLVEVAALQSSSHGHIPVEGEVHRLGQEVAKFVPEAGVAPLHYGTVSK